MLFLSMFSATECKCADGYGQGNYCDLWQSMDYVWCYLQGGKQASSCQGAVKTVMKEAGDLYWTKHPEICEVHTRGENMNTMLL